MRWLALLLGILTVAPAAAEAALRLYMSYFPKPAQLFRTDAQTGWSNAPNLMATCINAAGEEWSIKTDKDGQRLMAQEPYAERRILILGNSLSFGEGVDIKDRFDVKMLSSLAGARVINTGTMGYGTDQEYVVFRNWKHVLEPGDAILIVLNQSDYSDVSRRRFFGRSKPYFEKENGFSSSAAYRPVGTLERPVPSGKGRRKIYRANDSRERGSSSIDRDHPFHSRSDSRRSAPRRDSGPGPSGHPRVPWAETRPVLDDPLQVCGRVHRSR